MTERSRQRIERWFVALVAVHSASIGAILLLAADWGVRFGGWQDVAPLFFVRQVGIFHFVLAGGYLLEYLRYRGVLLIILAKGCAVPFLIAMMVIDGSSWALPWAALGDGLMAIVAVMLHRAAHAVSGS